MNVEPKARQSIHKTILKWFVGQKRGTVLDVPAGYGHLSLRLAEMGFQVTAGEIEPAIFAAETIPCIYMDLNRAIDAPDESFDYVCCVDGLEHMTDPYRAVKELSRVLKTRGIAVFSIPNYSNIERRMKFLLHGYFTKPITMERYHREGSNLFNFHNSILTITILDFLFRMNMLEITDVLENAKKKNQMFYLPIVLLLWGINSVISRAHSERNRTDLTLAPRIILGGNNLIFILKKISSKGVVMWQNAYS